MGDSRQCDGSAVISSVSKAYICKSVVGPTRVMPRPKPKSHKPRAKHLTARSISLQDAKGKTRIYMDAGNGNGYATICLFGEEGRSIQVSTSPEGGLHVSLLGKRGMVSATLGMTKDEDAGLSIRDRRGLLGTMLGSVLEPGEHRLILFRSGQPYWSTPRLPSRRRRKK
jgi:hypothetical protein